jgi:hypothetical protein
MKETLNDHRYISLSEVFKEKECIEVRIGDFNIDCVLDEKTQVNIITKRTWEAIGNIVMIPSLGGIGLFIGKLKNLCGKITQTSMNAKGTSTEEEFKFVKFIKDIAPFTMFPRKPWIERDRARREEKEVLEQKKQELKDFMTRKITHLIEEQENQAKLFKTKDWNVKAGRTLEDLQNIAVPILDTDKILPLISRREYQQREVTMPKEDKNQNGKRNYEMKPIGKKDRKLSKERAKIEKL